MAESTSSVKAPSAVTRTSTTHDAASPGTRARILLVDDDRIILDSLGEFLQLEDY